MTPQFDPTGPVFFAYGTLTMHDEADTQSRTRPEEAEAIEIPPLMGNTLTEAELQEFYPELAEWPCTTTASEDECPVTSVPPVVPAPLSVVIILEYHCWLPSPQADQDGCRQYRAAHGVHTWTETMGPSRLVTWRGDPRASTWDQIRHDVLEAIGSYDSEVADELRSNDRYRDLLWEGTIPDLREFGRGVPFRVCTDVCWEIFTGYIARTTATSKIYLRLFTNRPYGRTAVSDAFCKAMHIRHCPHRNNLIAELERRLHTEATHLDGNSGHIQLKVKWAPGGQKFIRMSAAVIHGWARAIVSNPSLVTLDTPPVGREYLWEGVHAHAQLE
ncbi:uncharacterized protein PGTG_12993 [Puccinia graminis f. sp. tritici CRL 75-36-700-3]|uniref:Uncharacterized protein n=1 Tax=Puccinia graminis f. sp. tritici (strain CRL 75-36-700-3 / race SCCL) TaxID=418459 RepID=E3KQN6_PUCGT|nr:uncharacterized protein PGTG_12993 [Puccinia graminis f. sp. tritici CRL 75-36-700-3]EFP86611.1 hypothetical protein PGTG_12993 [Puccinia graminis f. sp. tritici CRL 75-36-700-3]